MQSLARRDQREERSEGESMSIKRLLIIFALLGGFAVAQTTTTITGTVKDLTQALATSGKVTFDLMPSADTTMSGIARFTPSTVTCLINSSGQIQSLSAGTCTLTMNTALQPTGSYYKVCYWPYNVKTACFTFYAVLSTYDWSTVVPTPATSPAQNYVDIFSNQTVGGNKTFSGTSTFSGPTVFGANVVVVPVEAFGAVGDWNGSTGTDNTTAIQN